MTLDQLIIGAPTECWPWSGAITGPGYGNLVADGRNVAAHRFVYALVHGPIDPALDVHHVCENRTCCNPAHLQALTRAEHTRTKRGHVADQTRRTHCPRGHAYDYLAPGTRKRGCLTCRRAQARARRHA